MHLFFSEDTLVAAYKELCKTVPDGEQRIAFRISENEEGEEFELALPDPGPLPVELLESRERRQAIRAAIDALPEHHRTVILLRELDGMSYQDIAKVMGLTEGTVKSRINRARARLRQLLLEGNFFEERATKEKDNGARKEVRQA